MAWTPPGSIGPVPITAGGTESTSVISSPTAGSWAGWDGNANFSANNLLSGLSIVTTSGGTTTLTAASHYNQIFNGTLNETVVMPDVTTLALGQGYRLVNRTSGVVTVNSSGSDLIQAMDPNSALVLICVATTGTDETSWIWVYNPTAPFNFPLAPNLGGTGIDNGSNTLTIGANSAINQDVSTTSSPTFAQLNVDNLRLDGNTVSSTDTNGNINIAPNGTGLILCGTNSVVINNPSTFQIARNGSLGLFTLASYANSASPVTYYAVKSRSATIGSPGAVQNGDGLYALNVLADDGTNTSTRAAIGIDVTGAVSGGIVPTNMYFRTTNTSGALTTGMTIDNAQNSTFAGSVTANAGFVSGISGTSSALNRQNTAASNGTSYTITKSGSASSVTTFLQITVPASFYFIGIECLIINSRAPSASIGTSLVEKRYFSIVRSGNTTDVVLDSSAGPDFTSTTTAGGGSLNAISGVTAIVRNGAEPVTDPQVVNLTINPQVTGPSTGSFVAQCNILVLGATSGLIIS